MELSMDIHVKRSKRKTLSLEIRPNGTLLVRAPSWMTDSAIRHFVERKADWIARHLQKLKEDSQINPPEDRLTAEEARMLAQKAAEEIPKRVEYYAKKLRVDYGRITIRMQKTRWGSCGRGGNLNFNCLLMLAPSDVLDYVVVHELCHRKEMNHSNQFWREVEKILPDYPAQKKWLKENGERLIGRGCEKSTKIKK